MQPRLAILHRTIRLMQDVVPRFALTLDPEETRARRALLHLPGCCRTHIMNGQVQIEPDARQRMVAVEHHMLR